MTRAAKRRFPKLSTETAQRLAVQSVVQAVKAELLRDVMTGDVPATCASFSELHDYVDANMYAELSTEAMLELLGERIDTDGGSQFLNAVQDDVNAWLLCGELLRAVDPDAQLATWYVYHTGGNCQALRHDLESLHGAYLLATTAVDVAMPCYADGSNVRVTRYRSDYDRDGNGQVVVTWAEWVTIRKDPEAFFALLDTHEQGDA